MNDHLIRGDRAARAAGAAHGICLAIALIAIARPASGHGGVLPATLSVAAHQDGAIAISPASPRPLIPSTRMRPGGRARGSLLMTNQTGSRLAVRLRATPSSTGLDGIVRVRVRAGGDALADTTIQGLRQGSSALTLAAGEARRVRLLAWIPNEIETGYEGRVVSVGLVPVETPGGGP